LLLGIRRYNAHLDTVNDPDASTLIDSSNISGVNPALVIDGFLGILLIYGMVSVVAPTETKQY
jgi:hypothetical protein